VVLDPGGALVVQKRMDGCSAVAIPDFAHAKAFTCRKARAGCSDPSHTQRFTLASVLRWLTARPSCSGHGDLVARLQGQVMRPPTV
jgi:uncharacterized protein GlcG (DUF336 family)